MSASTSCAARQLPLVPRWRHVPQDSPLRMRLDQHYMYFFSLLSYSLFTPSCLCKLFSLSLCKANACEVCVDARVCGCVCLRRKKREKKGAVKRMMKNERMYGRKGCWGGSQLVSTRLPAISSRWVERTRTEQDASNLTTHRVYDAGLTPLWVDDRRRLNKIKHEMYSSAKSDSVNRLNMPAQNVRADSLNQKIISLYINYDENLC